jgi:hypothetical protein
LHAKQAGGKTQKPDTETFSRPTLAALNGRRACTKASTLGRQSKNEAHQGTCHGEYMGVTPSFYQACDIQQLLQ